MTENAFCVTYAPRRAAPGLALQTGEARHGLVKVSAVYLIPR